MFTTRVQGKKSYLFLITFCLLAFCQAASAQRLKIASLPDVGIEVYRIAHPLSLADAEYIHGYLKPFFLQSYAPGIKQAYEGWIHKNPDTDVLKYAEESFDSNMLAFKESATHPDGFYLFEAIETQPPHSIVGTVTFKRIAGTDDTYIISRVTTSKRGILTKLFKSGLAYLQPQPKKVILGVMDSNVQAREVYEHWGFKTEADKAWTSHYVRMAIAGSDLEKFLPKP